MKGDSQAAHRARRPANDVRTAKRALQLGQAITIEGSVAAIVARSNPC
jgi:hypothetical protein